jgi:hypothetical protein
MVAPPLLPRKPVAAAGSKPQIDLQQVSFVVTCFSADAHLAVGQPPKFPPAPPLTLSIGMQARRRSVDAAIVMQLDGLDISILR